VFGEDGTIQGLFELAGIPYVGAGVLGSAIGMDKVVQKQLLRQGGIPVTADVWFTSAEFNKNRKKVLASTARSIRFPAFVKPANLGSSIGISKVRNVKELETAVDLASTYDRRILVEKAVPRAREIECSVLGNDDPSASLPGEVVPSNEFYDYDAKYVDGKSTSIVPAKLPKSVVRKIQDISILAFRILDCAGMARVDFLVPAGTTRVFLNEINTIPGFTPISMYPKLWEASGLSYPELLDRLIQLALERHEARSRLQTAYRPKAGWYKE
jgi:D-alanine-D-alanine ligase